MIPHGSQARPEELGARAREGLSERWYATPEQFAEHVRALVDRDDEAG